MILTITLPQNNHSRYSLANIRPSPGHQMQEEDILTYRLQLILIRGAGDLDNYVPSAARLLRQRSKSVNSKQ